MSDRVARSKEIFAALAEMPPERWSAELDARIAAGETELRREVESLLKFHAGAATFLNPAEIANDSVARGLPRLGLDVEPDLLPGQRLGEYTIERLIGTGGMGSVYLARQGKPARTVALKVIRRGLSSRSLVRRFEAEAEVLGRLQHPGIAQIFEAGEAVVDGRGSPHPFIAMEHVDGPTITEFAERHRLDVKQCMDLLARVCDAVHHAHQRGVIHRDIKPRNILVDSHAEPPQPKVLDFGVARAADADLRVTTMQTSVGQLIGTLPYMSPEQVGGDPRELDVRSDVYALGVLMFQLLTGRLPHDLSNRSIPDAARVIREEPHVRLSSVSRVFRGELEVIAGKAMEKDRTRRYQTASELAEDLRRYVRAEPIMARQDSALYVIRKQLARHRWLVRTAMFGLVSLVAFAVYASWQAARNSRLAMNEREARIEADQARERADKLSLKLADELSRARIDVGRLEGAARRMPLAEQTLWSEFLAAADAEEHADPRFTSGPAARAYWALWELYDRLPCQWTKSLRMIVRAGATSPDGQLFVVGGDDGTLIVMNTASGEEVRRVSELGAGVMAIAVSASHVFACLRDGRVAVAALRGDTNSPPEWLERSGGAAGERTGPLRALSLSPDGKLLASAAGGGEVVIWDVESRRELRAIRAHDEQVVVLAFSKDGRRLLSSARIGTATSAVRVWSVTDGSMLHEARPEGPFVPMSGLLLDGVTDGRERVILGDDTRRLRVLEMGQGPTEVRETVFSGPLVMLRPSADAERILAVAGHSTLVLDARTLAVRFQHGDQRQSVLGAGWVDESSYMIASFDGQIRRFGAVQSPATRVVRIVPHWCFGVSFDAALGRVWIAGSDASVHALDGVTLAPLHVTSVGDHGRVRALLHEPMREGAPRRVFAGASSGDIRVLDAESGEQLSVIGTKAAEVFSLAIDPTGRVLASGAADGTLKLWNTEDGTPRLELTKQARRVESIAFSPDGGVLAASGQPQAVTLFDSLSGKPVASLTTSAMPWGVAFTPDGALLLVSLFNGGVDAFETTPPYRRRTIQAHQRLVPALAVHPSGQVFATGSEDGLISLWQVSTLDKLATFDPQFGEVITAVFDPSGRWLYASSAGGMLIRIDLESSNRFVEAHRVGK